MVQTVRKRGGLVVIADFCSTPVARSPVRVIFRFLRPRGVEGPGIGRNGGLGRPDRGRSRPRGLDQRRNAEDGDGAPEILGERGETEFGADVFETAHQECALVHPLFDRTVGVAS